MLPQSFFAIDTPFGFGKDGTVEIGISDFSVWHQKGAGVPDPDIKQMGFFITTAEAQTLLEYDLAQVCRPSSMAFYIKPSPVGGPCTVRMTQAV